MCYIRGEWKLEKRVCIEYINEEGYVESVFDLCTITEEDTGITLKESDNRNMHGDKWREELKLVSKVIPLIVADLI